MLIINVINFVVEIIDACVYRNHNYDILTSWRKDICKIK